MLSDFQTDIIKKQIAYDIKLLNLSGLNADIVNLTIKLINDFENVNIKAKMTCGYNWEPEIR